MMGVDYYSRLIVGMPLSAVYEEKDALVDVVRYDPVTGIKHYTKDKVLQRRFCGKQLPDVRYFKGYVGEQAEREWGFLEAVGLKVFFPDDYEMSAAGLVGIQVGGTSREDDWNQNGGYVGEFQPIADAVWGKLKGLGCKESDDVAITVWNQLCVSC